MRNRRRRAHESGAHLRKLPVFAESDRALVATDENVRALLIAPTQKEALLQKAGSRVSDIAVPAGEGSKSVEVAGEIWEAMASLRSAATAWWWRSAAAGWATSPGSLPQPICAGGAGSNDAAIYGGLLGGRQDWHQPWRRQNLVGRVQTAGVLLRDIGHAGYRLDERR